MTFTITIHPLCQFRLVLPLHKNHPIYLQTKSTGWFLYNGNTANSRLHLFQILILTWLKIFFITFPKFNLTRLISQKQLKNYQILDDESSYHISTPLLSILISSKQQLKQHMWHYPKDTAIKYLIMTESCKLFYLPGSFDQNNIYFPTWSACCQHCCHWVILHVPTML